MQAFRGIAPVTQRGTGSERKELVSLMQVKRLQRDTLTTTVAHELRRLILDGEAKPGELLPPQPELAQRLGVGLSTLREAIKGWALFGVLVLQPGRGTLVSPDAIRLLHITDLCRIQLEGMGAHDVHETRCIIEMALTELAAERATREDLSRIEAALTKMRRASQDDKAFIEADQEFHLAVAKASKNQLLKHFYQIVMEMFASVLREAMHIPSVAESFRSSGLDQQEKIFAAIRDHLPEVALKRTEELFADWDDFYFAALGMDD